VSEAEKDYQYWLITINERKKFVKESRWRLNELLGSLRKNFSSYILLDGLVCDILSLIGS
jgi:hypothetical protein